MFGGSRLFSRSMMSVRSDVSDVSQGRERTERHHIFSRLHLPSSSGFLEKPSFPFRLIGTLSYIDPSKREFNVLINCNNVDSAALMEEFDSYFNVAEENADPAEKQRNEFDLLSSKCKRVKDPKSGAFYAALIDHPLYHDIRVRRVKVLQKRTEYTEDKSCLSKVDVYVLDIGLQVELFEKSLFELPKEFCCGDFQTYFTLKCRLPDDRLLAGAPFPRLEDFKLKDHVEVYILSDYEPCLAVMGSLSTGPNSIPRELLLHEMDHLCIDSFNRTLSSSTLPAAVNEYKGWAPSLWTHGSSCILVTVLSSENPMKVAVRDVFTSLRFCFLQQAINRSYKKPEFRQAMVVDPLKLFIGSPVVTFHKPLDSYIRGTITSLDLIEGSCDFEALDIPDTIILQAPINRVFYPSALLLEVPPQVFTFNIATMVRGSHQRLKCLKPLICADVSPNVEELIPPNSVAILKLSNIGADIENHKKQSVREYLYGNFHSKKEDGALGYVTESCATSCATSRTTSRAPSVCEDQDW